MAFECPKGTELSQNLVYLLEKSSEEKVERNLICSKPHTEGITFSELSLDPKPIIENSENSKSVTKYRSKKGITVSSDPNELLSKDELPIFHQSITDLPPALISEILNCLDPKELGIVSCVSNLLHRIASEHHVWKEFYCERWGLPTVPALLGSEVTDDKSWRELFVEREFRTKTFMGRYSMEVLYGHTEAVLTVFLLASAKLIFTSGYDSIVRMWDMEDGLSISSSRPLGCTIRAVTADASLLVAGGTHGFIHCWRVVEGLPHLFELRGERNQHMEFRLWGHDGPITTLSLDQTRIYSASWDMTIRMWDRNSQKCTRVLWHSDWVWGFVPHDTTIASAAGIDVYIWDTNSGSLLTIIHNAHVGNTFSLARSHMGDFLFTGGEDGAIHMYEIRTHSNETDALHVARWVPHASSVNSLAFEFPWLISASSDGKLSLIDVRKLLRTRRHGAGKSVLKAKYTEKSTVEPPKRMLHGFGSNLFSVDIGADRIVCGGEEGVVRIWNFSQALETERRIRALRGIRLENRMRRRRLQMEMSNKGGRNDQCSLAAKKNTMNGDRSGVWHKRGMSGKLKA